MDKAIQRPEAMIFDVDGTLFQTELIAIAAFQDTLHKLKEEGVYSGDIPDKETVMSWFGMTTTDLWEKLLPEADSEQRRRADDLVLQAELDRLSKGQGRLYMGVADTIEQLHKRGISLFTASNGRKEYVQGVLEATGIARYFTALYSAGEYHTEKKEQLVAIILQQYRLKDAFMVGDRMSDIIAGKQNRLFTVGCNFGFAKGDELYQADVVIENFTDLLHLVDSRDEDEYNK